MPLPRIFATLPQGNVPASYLDDNFNAAYNYTAPVSNAATGTVAVELGRQYPVAMDWTGVDPAGIVDSTAGIQNALNDATFVNGGVLRFPGKFKISSTLTCTKPILLLGQGPGEFSLPVTTPASQLVWAGGASDVLHYGGFGTTILGGGIKNLAIDGQSLATNCLVVKDLTRAAFKNIMLTNAITNALLLQNTLGQFVTSFLNIEDLRIYLAASGATLAANGIAIQGVTGGVSDGVTLCIWKRVRIDHANGVGVLIGTGGAGTQDAGDGMTWYDLYTFRPNANTGFGVNFASINASSIINQHRFYGPQVTGGFNFATPALNYGTTLINASEVDLNTNVTQLMSGAGTIDVLAMTQSGAAFGRGMIQNLHWSTISDAFMFGRYDSANQILQTGNGNWTTVNASGGTFTDAAVPGGGVTMTTAATTGTFVAIYQPNNVSSGLRSVTTPMMSCNHVLSQALNTQMRMGFFDSTLATIQNGVYVEYDNAVSNFWRFICRKAGVETAIILTLGPNIGLIWEWVIRFDSSFATANYRAGGFTGIGNAGVISTNIPTVTMFFGVSLRTGANVAKSMIINSIKAGFLDENYPQT